jgi:hypothetical protein
MCEASEELSKRKAHQKNSEKPIKNKNYNSLYFSI